MHKACNRKGQKIYLISSLIFDFNPKCISIYFATISISRRDGLRNLFQVTTISEKILIKLENPPEENYLTCAMCNVHNKNNIG